MKKYVFLAIVTISFFFGLEQISIASAANVCVGPSPSGNGSGSDWNNIAEWSTVTLTRGNTYYLQDGTYGSKTLSIAISGQTYIYLKKARASAYGPTIGWSSTYGDGVATFDTASLTILSDFWDIDGATGGGPDGIQGANGVRMQDKPLRAVNGRVEPGQHPGGIQVMERGVRTYKNYFANLLDLAGILLA